MNARPPSSGPASAPCSRRNTARPGASSSKTSPPADALLQRLQLLVEHLVRQRAEHQLAVHALGRRTADHEGRRAISADRHRLEQILLYDRLVLVGGNAGAQ